MALAAALCVAAATGIVAILTGDFDRTEGEVVLTSLGFAVFSATTAPGASLRLRESEGLRALGAATVGFSVVSFALLAIALWTEGEDALWRAFGCAGFVALACSHASLVLGARRPSDGPALEWLCTASIALGATDALFGVIAASGVVDEVDRGFVEFVAVLVILLVLTTALQPIARRLAREPTAKPQRPSSPAPAPAEPRAPQPLAAEVLAAADRIDALNADSGNRAVDIQREVDRLRELARTYSR